MSDEEKEIVNILRQIEAEELVRVVRCKDCKYFDSTVYCCLCGGKMYGFPTSLEWFCADGKPKDGDGE